MPAFSVENKSQQL